MSNLAIQWTLFGFCAGIILVAGQTLSRSADVIAEKAGLGRTWVGLIMLATVTSLPELFSGISAVTVIDAPDLTIGSLMGSCVFNLALLAILDFASRHSPLYTTAGQGHVLSAAMGIGMISFVGFALLFGGLWQEPNIAHVGVSSIALIIIYFFACQVLFQYEKRNIQDSLGEVSQLYAEASLNRAITLYVVAGSVVVAAAMALPVLGEKIAMEMEWNESFVGTLFIAFGTSLPELVVTITAVRLGAVDMAISNVLGSNLFNMAIIGILDFLYSPGPILSHVKPLHAATAFSALIMSALVIIGLFYRPKRQVLNLVGWISILLVCIFIMNSMLLFYSAN